MAFALSVHRYFIELRIFSSMGISVNNLLIQTTHALSANLIRSGLTLLGVFMGVAALNATLNIAAITEAQIQAKLAERDKPYVSPYLNSQGEFSAEMKLTAEDEIALKQNIPSIRAMSSVSQVSSIQSVQFEGNKADSIQSLGVSKNYIETTGRKILQGRFFKPIDYTQYRPVAVIDQTLASSLFQEKSPLNQAIFTDNTRMVVIGIVESKSLGQDFGKSSGQLWVPLSFASTISNDLDQSKTLQISAYTLEDMPALVEKVKQVLSQRHPQATVEATDNTADLLVEQSLQRSASRALAGVGLIALSIGGVGIANITIASVLERIKEIGIRRALGATQWDVMIQFIVEAVLLSVMGGGLAIVTVHGLTQTVTTTIVQAPYQFSMQNASLSMLAAIAVGVGASFFPALRATQVDIVAALRSE
jgi:putative ABC transport system permease protein